MVVFYAGLKKADYILFVFYAILGNKMVIYSLNISYILVPKVQTKDIQHL